MPFPIPNSGGKTENGPPGEICGCSVQKAGSLTGGRCGAAAAMGWGFLICYLLVEVGNILLWSCCVPPSTTRDADISTGFPARDRLIQLVCDRQKSQITENGTWKIKNEDMWNEFSICFCNIDFSSVLKMFVLNVFLSKGEKKKRNCTIYNKYFPVKKKFILMQLYVTFVQ